MQKWTVVKGSDIRNKAKNVSVVFEELTMQNKYNSIHCRRRNMFFAVTLVGGEIGDAAVCLWKGYCLTCVIMAAHGNGRAIIFLPCGFFYLLSIFFFLA